MNDDDLLRTLESGRPAEMRVLAAQTLSGRTAPAVIDGLTRALSDPAPVVRIAAAQALAASAANLLRGAAETLLDDPAVPDATGVELLGSMVGTAGLALLRSIVDSEDAGARIRAAEILVSVPRGRAVSYLRDVLDAAEADAIAAAAVLAPLGEDPAIEFLEAALADESEPAEARRVAARGLLDCRTPSQSQAVAEALRDHRLVLEWHSAQPVPTADLVDDAIASDFAPLRAAGAAARDHIVLHLEQTHEDDLEHALGELISFGDHEARIRGGEVVLGLGSDETIVALCHLVDERFDDASVQLCEVAAVLGAVDHVGALPPLLRLADHADWYTRLLAIQGIEKHPDPAAAPKLYEIAGGHHTRKALRRAALKAIERMPAQGDGALEALLACVLGRAENPAGPDEEISRGAGRVIAEIKLFGAIEPLCEALVDDRPAVRRAAAWALGEMSAKDGLLDLIRLLELDDDVAVRQASAWALGRIGHGVEQLPALIAALDDEPGVRDQAALALGELRLPTAAAALRRALDQSQSVDVQDRLVWAVGELKDEEAVPQLLVLLVEGDAVVRRRCAEVLGRIGAPAAGDLLCRRVTVETDPEVRTAVLHALGELAWVEATQPVERAAQDRQSATVRRAAVQVLGRIGDRETLRLLRAIAQGDRDQSVRDAARAAYERLFDQLPPTDDDSEDDQAAA